VLRGDGVGDEGAIGRQGRRLQAAPGCVVVVGQWALGRLLRRRRHGEGAEDGGEQERTCESSDHDGATGAAREDVRWGDLCRSVAGRDCTEAGGRSASDSWCFATRLYSLHHVYLRGTQLTSTYLFSASSSS